MDHGTYLYLMDPHGKFVRGFDADTPGDRLAEAVRGAMARRLRADPLLHLGNKPQGGPMPHH